MAKPIRSCYLQNDDFILYPKTADVMVVDKDGKNLQDKINAINEQIEQIAETGTNIDLSNYATKDFVSQELSDKLNQVLKPESIPYTNDKFEDLTDIGKAIDFLLENNKKEISIDWDKINNKPQIANGLALTETELILKSDDDSISSVPIVEDYDIDNIINEL